jgi:hypothetical protein
LLRTSRPTALFDKPLYRGTDILDVSVVCPQADTCSIGLNVAHVQELIQIGRKTEHRDAMG